jgi:hypothetical protein
MVPWRKTGGLVDIELRYFDDCPNWQMTDALVKRLVEELGVDAQFRRTLVNTQEVAERLGFVGSPTLLINGVDPFGTADAPVGLSCRVYRTEAGFAGSPSEEQLREAIRVAR